MTKKLISLILALALVLSLAAPVVADETDETAETLNYIVDDVNAFTDEEWLTLETKAIEIAADYNCSVHAILTDNYLNFGNDIEEACVNVYNYYTLGADTGNNVIILMISLSQREYVLQDYGELTYSVMTSYSHQELEDSFVDNLSNDDWYGGIYDYLDKSEELLSVAVSGEYSGAGAYDDYDDYYDYYGEVPDEYYGRTPLGERLLSAYGAAFIVAVIIAFIICSVFKSQMKTAARATSAAEYVAPEGIDMRIRQDRFIRTTRTRRRIQKNNNNNNRSSGSRSGGMRSGGARSSRPNRSSRGKF